MMNTMPQETAVLETPRRRANREELARCIARALPQDGVIEPLPGLTLARLSSPGRWVHTVMEPSLCIIAQGAKEVLVGDTRYRYDPQHYLITTLDLPRSSAVMEAAPEQPYLSARLVLDPVVVGAVVAEAGLTAHAPAAGVRAVDVCLLDEDLQDAVLRLVRLTGVPSEAPVLLPMVTREIVYRLLIGAQGARLRHLLRAGGYAPQIARAVERLRREFDQPLRMEELAQELGMSVSGLHHHFKAVTAMSPLQFQKQLRLQEARRLMLSEDLDAATTAYRLGYHDPAHFSREYKSLFGVPPARDAQRLRGTGLEQARG